MTAEVEAVDGIDVGVPVVEETDGGDEPDGADRPDGADGANGADDADGIAEEVIGELGVKLMKGCSGTCGGDSEERRVTPVVDGHQY